MSMKFRTRISNPSILFKIGQALEKIQKTWIVKLSPDRLFFVLCQSEQGIRTFSQLQVKQVFEDYRIESLNRNEIWLEVPGEHWVRSLKCSQQASDTTMKLTKKEGLPILSLSMNTNSRSGKSLFLIQDIPVRVLTQEQAAELQEPRVPEPEVHIVMPSLLSMRSIVERIRSLSHVLTVSANMEGQFKLKAETDIVSVETFYRDLMNPELEDDKGSASKGGEKAQRDAKQFADCQVDVKDFFKFSHCYLAGPSNVICCIVQNHSLVLYVYLEDEDSRASLGNMTYYLPHKQS